MRSFRLTNHTSKNFIRYTVIKGEDPKAVDSWDESEVDGPTVLIKVFFNLVEMRLQRFVPLGVYFKTGLSSTG